MTTDTEVNPASYKDSAGFIFTHKQQSFRQVNQSYASRYDCLMQSGLYALLTGKKMLISHTEVAAIATGEGGAYKTLLPEQLEFISYPYEWAFAMLRDAALLTLQVNLLAIQKGMILKDASAFNVQFQHGRPVFIDTLSFELFDETKPWIAYPQFCRHFLFPLLLNHYCGFEAQQLLGIYLDGLPAAFTAKLLPFATRFKLGTALHVHLQSRVGKVKQAGQSGGKFDRGKTERLLLHLQSVITKLKYPSQKTTWNDYYSSTITSQQYLKEKEDVFLEMMQSLPVKKALDFGANDGHFSRLLAGLGISVVAADFDGACINRLYEQTRETGSLNIIPLMVNISNPPPATGFNNKERPAFLQRIKADLVVALALIHHLHFTENLPLAKMADMFHHITERYLLIEFVPPADEKVTVIAERKGATDEMYNEALFEHAFKTRFRILQKRALSAGRILYLMEK